MRQHKRAATTNSYSILTLDDDPIMTSTLQAYFQRSGYQVDVENDPYQAIERVREGHYDILLLDFLMTPICGDQVVEEIRKFNGELFIILLTGHKSMAPPLKTIRELDIQGYYEKSDRFDQLELLVESCVKAIKQNRTIRSYKNGLSSIVESLPQIYQLRSVEDIADSIINKAVELLGCSRAFLGLDAPLTGLLNGTAGHELFRCFGVAPSGEELMKAVEAAKGCQGASRHEKKIAMLVPDEKERAMGIMGVELEEEPRFDQVQLFEIFVRQASAALHNARLHALVSQKNKELTEAYARLRDGYMETVSAIRSLVDAKDIYTRGHSDRVSQYACQIAKAMGKPDEYCERLRIAGLFHDIGKIGIPDEILHREGKLEPEEYEEVKNHTVRGAQILANVSFFSDVVPIVRAHHEWVDGKGYPDGLKGEEIPEEARMIGVVDAFDAMTSHRQYRKNLDMQMARQELINGKGTQFDAAMVDIFLDILSKENPEGK
ncbi:HD domain-containing response regulator [Zongyangia hominis]|uniref:Stage 0 sporulation protein A homolog n=1 Tax=Zongyangia hominis TaxID=2763677 RepID=A0A926E7J3_9FIRM|nr:HD domain-containing response regulator [Zongyangia hominis]MBC8569285.1 HD domain-containing response regulator [Zongyangia hominis]